MKKEEIKEMTLTELLDSRIVKMIIMPDINFPDSDKNSGVNYNGGFSLNDIAYDAGFNEWEDFISSKGYIVDAMINKFMGSYKKIDKSEVNIISKNNHMNRQGFVYLMRNKRNGYTKIGFSNNPEFREKTLQSEEPEIKLLCKFKSIFSEEYWLHHEFKSKRLRGEWFDLNDSDIQSIITYFED